MFKNIASVTFHFFLLFPLIFLTFQSGHFSVQRDEIINFKSNR